MVPRLSRPAVIGIWLTAVVVYSGCGRGSSAGNIAAIQPPLFVYVGSTADGSISSFRESSSTGALSQVGPAVVTPSQTLPYALATSVTEHCIFAGTNGAESSVLAYRIDSGGGLIELSRTAYKVPLGVLAFARNATTLYVATSTAISAFKIDDSDCSLSEFGDSPFMVAGVTGMAVVGGTYLVCVNSDVGAGQGLLSVYAIDMSGGLSLVGDPVTIAGPNYGIASDGAHFVYVTTSPGPGGPANSAVLTFNVDNTGGLTQVATTPTGVAPTQVAVAGSLLYLVNNGPSPAVSTFTRNNDGTLLATSHAASLTRPGTSLTIDSGAAHVYVGIAGDGGLAAFDTRADGSLVPVAGSPFLAGKSVDLLLAAWPH